MTRPLLLALMILATAPSWATTEDALADIQSFIQNTVETLDVQTGVSVRVVIGDQVELRHDSGFADIEAERPVDRQTAFYIASVTKPFTALAVLALAEDGKIDLERSLAAYFPEITFDPDLMADQINIRHLLSHTSGIENDALVVATAFSGIHTPQTLLEILAQSTPSTEAPFGTYDYTNVGYNIVSMILDRALDTPWQDIVHERVFEPLAMSRTSSRMSTAEQANWTVAKPYSLTSPTPEKALYLSKADNTMHAAGGMIASSDDLARMVIAQLNQGRVDGSPVLPAEVIEASQQMVATGESSYDIYERHGYGYGWNIGSLNGEPLIHHFGGFAGTHAHVSFMPQHGIGLVVLNNEDMLARRLTGFIAAYAYGRLSERPDIEADIVPEVQKIAQMLPMLNTRGASEREKVLARPWELSLAQDDYIGVYAHPLLGKIQVARSADDVLLATFGNMHAQLTAFTRPDSMRVEFVPGSGRVIQFTVESDRVSALEYDGLAFRRSP